MFAQPPFNLVYCFSILSQYIPLRLQFWAAKSGPYVSSLIPHPTRWPCIHGQGLSEKQAEQCSQWLCSSKWEEQTWPQQATGGPGGRTTGATAEAVDTAGHWGRAGIWKLSKPWFPWRSELGWGVRCSGTAGILSTLLPHPAPVGHMAPPLFWPSPISHNSFEDGQLRPICGRKQSLWFKQQYHCKRTRTIRFIVSLLRHPLMFLWPKMGSHLACFVCLAGWPDSPSPKDPCS